MKHLSILLSAWFSLQLAAPAFAAERLWTDFDSSPTGSVASLPGWTRASWVGGGLTGLIVNAGASHSPSNTLELPWNLSGSSAVYTGINASYNPETEHPVVRCSAKLYSSNTNAFFQIGLRNSSTGRILSYQSTNGYGVFGFQYRDSFFVPLVSDRFVDVAFFYNRSNNSYRCDVDFTNRLAWITNGESGLTVTQFNQFVATRLANTVQTTGSLLVDDVSVETFPPHVWAWWRCTLEPGAHVVEQLGSFKPTLRAGYGDATRAGSSDPVWDGAADFHNSGSLRQLQAGPAAAALPLPATTNWTLEAAFLLPRSALNTTIFDWSTNFGFNATCAWIQIGYNTNGYVYANLRDSQQGDSTYVNLALRNYVPKGRWQHLAVVKSNSTLSLYVDYQLATNRALTPTADGSYAFSAASRAHLGISPNGANPSGENTLFDEIRFSTKNLVPSEFLQPGQPLVVAATNSATDANWELVVKGILGKSYRVETRPGSGSPLDWQPVPGATFTANYTFNFVDVPTAPRTNWIRVVREN